MRKRIAVRRSLKFFCLFFFLSCSVFSAGGVFVDLILRQLRFLFLSAFDSEEKEILKVRSHLSCG